MINNTYTLDMTVSIKFFLFCFFKAWTVYIHRFDSSYATFVCSPPPAVSFVPSAARYVSASQPVVGACTPPARGAAAPGGAAGDAAPPSAPCSPAAAG